MSEFPIVASKTALLFFDTLNAFLRPEDPVIPNMQRINAAARTAGIPVFYAQVEHDDDYHDFVPQVVDRDHYAKPGEPPRLSAPSNHSEKALEIISQLAPQPGDTVIKKHRWNAFFQTHFELSLRARGVTTLLLAGGSVEVGLGSTAYGARDRDFNQIVLRDACTGANPASFEAFMDLVFPRFCRVMTVDAAIAMIRT